MTDQLAATPMCDAEQQVSDYVRRWFVRFETLISRTGGTTFQIDALITAGAAPGAVYAQHSRGWWSALDAFRGRDYGEPPVGADRWYAPAAVYWLRRGLLSLRLGASPRDAAERNRSAFVDQFLEALRAEPLASVNYPELFRDGAIDTNAARSAGEVEWGHWRSGAYAVCLRSFTGLASVVKESLAKKIKEELASGARSMTDFELVDLVERLSSVLLPFAPFERPVCTPGLTVDAALERLGLGYEEPYV